MQTSKSLGNKGALLYRVNPVCALCEADNPDIRMSGLFCVTAFRTRERLPCDACGIYPSALCGGNTLLSADRPRRKVWKSHTVSQTVY